MTLITIRQGEKGPVLHMWVDGKEVGQLELETPAALKMVEDVIKRIVR